MFILKISLVGEMSSNYYKKRVGQIPTARGGPWMDETVTGFTIRPSA
jgi:hypothetical protein